MADYSDLESKIDSPIEYVVFDSIASTNDYLSKLSNNNTKTQICIALEQTNGRGQRGRRWLSGHKTSVIFSIGKHFNSTTVLNGLSLVIGLAIVEVIKRYGVDNPKLKWPNDVLINDKKLAGILLENTLKGDRQSVIIGLGLNVNLNDEVNCQTPWIDLNKILKTKVDLTRITIDLIHKILIFCEIFEQEGFSYFVQKWNKIDYLSGKKITYQHNKDSFTGICCGVDENGLLLIQTVDGIKKMHSSEFLSLC
ncbi:Biotin operon repressor / Biotin-protein ligase [uncultured Candidatus Thioglobus sp.]|nr:Biotin operon repressor / Biotin-protein ligase [uncultured Candidatus Thioglobus sp.]